VSVSPITSKTQTSLREKNNMEMIRKETLYGENNMFNYSNNYYNQTEIVNDDEEEYNYRNIPVDLNSTVGNVTTIDNHSQRLSEELALVQSNLEQKERDYEI
jgi:hypothetical protein